MKSSQLSIFNTVGEVKISYKTTGIPYAQLYSSRSAYEFLKTIWDADTLEYHESFCVLGLNQKNMICSYKFMSHGGLTATVVDPKMIFQFALLTNATALIISHNHPSGNLRPSDQDRLLTDKIKEVGKFMDLPLLDHVIMTASGFYSFADEGLI
jgi:DNA repair protein RadC